VHKDDEGDEGDDGEDSCGAPRAGYESARRHSLSEKGLQAASASGLSGLYATGAVLHSTRVPSRQLPYSFPRQPIAQIRNSQ
jgi:hypothetical protein